MVVTAKTIIKNQAEDYKTLEKESKKALRKQKVKTFLSNAFLGISKSFNYFRFKITTPVG